MGISLTELAVVFLVALVLFGPEKLPELARAVGKISGQLRKTSDSLRREFYNSIYPPGQEIRSEIAHGVDGLRALRAQALSSLNVSESDSSQSMSGVSTRHNGHSTGDHSATSSEEKTTGTV